MSVRIFILIGLVACFTTGLFGQDRIRIAVRSDDMGFSHAANVACIAVYKYGISRTVEILAPTPWFMEAVSMLKQYPNYDVGVHLCLTSEWENLRWRPLTQARSLVDENGYFPQFVWKNDDMPQGAYLLQREINMAEVEAELRAQIELVKKHVPQVSHLSAHMGFTWANKEMKALVDRLSSEYKLPIHMPETVRPIQGFSGALKSPREKIRDLANILDTLGTGTYYLIEHPAYDNDEMKTVFHKGYETVAYDRQGVTDAFTNRRVIRRVKKRNIELVAIKDIVSDK